MVVCGELKINMDVMHTSKPNKAMCLYKGTSAL